MIKDTHKIWCEKYRPKSLDEYIFHDPHQKAAIMRMVNDKSIPHLLLSGVQGTGKTTLAQILIRLMELDESDVIILNASDDRGIDMFRDVIKSFACTLAYGRFKIIHLEEADALTPQAQNALKRFMEEYSETVRFILTCNYEYKIIAPIKSRCQQFQFKASDKLDIAEYVVGILGTEKIKADMALVDKYIAYGYPDIRKIVNTLQQNSINGKLQEPKMEGSAGDWKFELLDLVARERWVDARKLVCANVVAEEWVDVYRFLYENLAQSPKFSNRDKWEEGILTIAKHLYQHSTVCDPEINSAAMFISLGQI